MRWWLAERIDEFRDFLGGWSFRLKYPAGRVKAGSDVKPLMFADYVAQERARANALSGDDLSAAENEIFRSLPFKEHTNAMD